MRRGRRARPADRAGPGDRRGAAADARRAAPSASSPSTSTPGARLSAEDLDDRPPGGRRGRAGRSPACTGRASRPSWPRRCSAACSPIRRRSAARGDRGALRARRRGGPRRRRLVRRLPAARRRRRSWSSATSSGTTPRRPRRWASCAALLRGIAHYSGAGPAEVLRGLDEAIAGMHTDTLATAAVARLEPAGRPDARPTPAALGQRRPSAADRRRARRAASTVLGGADRRPDARRGPHGRARGVGGRRSRRAPPCCCTPTA